MVEISPYVGTDEDRARLECKIEEFKASILFEPLTEAMLERVKQAIYTILMEEVMAGNMPPFKDKYEIVVRTDPNNPSAIDIYLQRRDE